MTADTPHAAPAGDLRPEADDKLIWMLRIIDAMGGQTDASDSRGHWMTLFCEPDQDPDTFNRAIDAKLLGCSHNSDWDTNTAWITDAGRALIAASDEALASAQPAATLDERLKALDAAPTASLLDALTRAYECIGRCNPFEGEREFFDDTVFIVARSLQAARDEALASAQPAAAAGDALREWFLVTCTGDAETAKLVAGRSEMVAFIRSMIVGSDDPNDIEESGAAPHLETLMDPSDPEWFEWGRPPSYRMDFEDGAITVALVTDAEEGIRALKSATPARTYTEAEPLSVVYRNWRGETSTRRIVPLAAPRFGTSEWHKEPQWLLRALDVDKGEEREFAMNEIAGAAAAEAGMAAARAEYRRRCVDATKDVIERDYGEPFDPLHRYARYAIRAVEAALPPAADVVASEAPDAV